MLSQQPLAVSITAVIVFASLVTALYYPRFPRGTVQEDYFGTTVHDPYRWLEDTDAEATKSFVDAQNDLSQRYFKQCPFRKQLRHRLKGFKGYSNIDMPKRHGKYYFLYDSDGQDQDVLYVRDTSNGDKTNWRDLLDPNTFSEDGTVALTDTQSFSADGEIFAYGISVSGSDWRTVHFLNVSTRTILDDVLIKVKFTVLVWKGNEGIFYGNYPDFEGNPEGSDTGTNENQKISYHRIGTPQSEDVIVVEFLDKPKNVINNMRMTRNEEYLIVTLDSSATDGVPWDYTAVYYVDLAGNNPSNWRTRPLVEQFNAAYTFVTDVSGIWYFLTNLNATRYKIVGIRLSSPDPASWTTLIEEDEENILYWAAPINGEYVLLHYLENVSSKLVLRSLIQGNTFTKNIDIEKGAVISYAGNIDDSIIFIKFESFFVPNRIYKLDFATPVSDIQLEIYDDVKMSGFVPALYKVKQVWYTSKDGTRVPMYIMHKKDLVLNGSSPTMLVGYGGFGVNVLPEFAIFRIVFMNVFDGVVAIANIRGGCEFGSAWHTGGSLLNKQNSFDDFHAAAEYLIAENYTSPSKMIIEGRSNGGLLVAACVNQRPELFGAAIVNVGVLDMLRYDKFTIGHTWVPEYGSPNDPVHFPNIYNYSPLHNILFPTVAGTQYPAILVMASDHDDRVVPSHSYKYIAELQYKIGSNKGQSQPLLLRVETDAGHGGGLPSSKLLAYSVDWLSFLIESLDLSFEGQKAHDSSSCGGNVHYSIIITFLTMSVALW
ncbi:prolyl endopeptidase-like [Bradysia coprophila]|uniref:prolyl endopeptidase-like n=1 Tax=Bradysia coprophila TaxID=38358 RepID=UPI00187DA710|nr:prolyl endopeptidase-like [Bradysia coprophila]